MKKSCYRVICLSLLLMAAGCASNLAKEISSSPAPDISLVAAQKTFNLYQNKPVRWGGIIIRIENQQEKSILEILAKPLNTYGQPLANVASSGRFLAEVAGFVDPSLHAPGRELTIYGTLTSLREKNIGEHKYKYPVINVTKYHLWALPEYYRYSDPYWDDYYWGYPGPRLWYPWGYYGYYPHPHRYR